VTNIDRNRELRAGGVPFFFKYKINKIIMKRLLQVLQFALLFIAIGSNAQQTIINDDHSLAEPNKAVVKHLDLTLKVDFEKRQLSGEASWVIDNIIKGNEIIFDDNGLEINRITLGDKRTPNNIFICLSSAICWPGITRKNFT
jgi:hypothetical protein